MIRYIALGVLVLMLVNALMPSSFVVKFLPFIPYWLDPLSGLSMMPLLFGLMCIASFIVSQSAGWLAFRNQNYGFSMLWATVPVVVVKLITTYLSRI